MHRCQVLLNMHLSLPSDINPTSWQSVLSLRTIFYSYTQTQSFSASDRKTMNCFIILSNNAVAFARSRQAWVPRTPWLIQSHGKIPRLIQSQETAKELGKPGNQGTKESRDFARIHLEKTREVESHPGIDDAIILIENTRDNAAVNYKELKRHSSNDRKHKQSIVVAPIVANEDLQF